MPVAVGADVEACGLQGGSAELNGLRGRVLQSAGGRWLVQFGVPDGVLTRKMRAENVRPAPAASPSPGTAADTADAADAAAEEAAPPPPPPPSPPPPVAAARPRTPPPAGGGAAPAAVVKTAASLMGMARGEGARPPARPRAPLPPAGDTRDGGDAGALWEHFLLSWAPQARQMGDDAGAQLRAPVRGIVAEWGALAARARAGPPAPCPGAPDGLLSALGAGWVLAWGPGRCRPAARRFLHDPASALRQRLRWPVYAPQRLSGTRVVVVGAGPGGLRAAIEARLHGAAVVVIEGRGCFSRMNVLKIWPFAVHDLNSLGMKDMLPSFGRDNENTTVPISFVQHALLRVALIVGVEVRAECTFHGLRPPPHDGAAWAAAVGAGEGELLAFDAVVDATGTGAAVCAGAGLRRVDIGGAAATWTAPASFAVTANFKRYPSELGTGQIATSQLAGGADFAAKRVALQNIVYFCSPVAHYLVATVDRVDTLLQHGVVREKPPPGCLMDLMRRGNVDRAALQRMLLAIAEDWGVPHECGFFEEGPPDALRPSASLFEFTQMRKAERGFGVLSGGGGQAVAVVGDALVDPWWPEGTGVNRCVVAAMQQAATLAEHVERRPDVAARAAARLRALHASASSDCSRNEYQTFVADCYGAAPDGEWRLRRSRLRGGADPRKGPFDS